VRVLKSPRAAAALLAALGVGLFIGWLSRELAWQTFSTAIAVAVASLTVAVIGSVFVASKADEDDAGKLY